VPLLDLLEGDMIAHGGLSREYLTYLCRPDQSREVCWRCCERIEDGAKVRVSRAWSGPGEPPPLEHADGCTPMLTTIEGRAGRTTHGSAPAERGSRTAMSGLPRTPAPADPSVAMPLVPGLLSRVRARLWR
jgi:hypothetical protein